jgi:UDP-2-acetamido-2-deoxy-ribo-hexuluronate aminotransferase
MVDIDRNIQMVDLQAQYQRLKPAIDAAIHEVVTDAAFIKGPALKRFENNLSKYLDIPYVIGVANGTDALQLAFMALGLKAGDEVLVPAFTYVATAEVIGLLGLTPIMVDVNPDSFNMDIESARSAVTSNTKAIVPVHLYGQSADMESVMSLANEYSLYVVEDNAQALGSEYTFNDCSKLKTGTIGHIGCTSFFPSKNLGCFGDGGALFTSDANLAEKIRMIANHGQRKKYYHSVLGVNSRLDTLQAAILDVKLKELDDFARRRNEVAKAYDEAFASIDWLETPVKSSFSNHVYHQYTLKIKNGRRDKMKDYLQAKGIPSMIYYPLPLYEQEAFNHFFNGAKLEATEVLCKEVLSLPIHTEMKEDDLNYIIETVKDFKL